MVNITGCSAIVHTASVLTRMVKKSKGHAFIAVMDSLNAQQRVRAEPDSCISSLISKRGWLLHLCFKIPKSCILLSFCDFLLMQEEN